MAYEVIILGPLHMPLYFLGTFTEYPFIYNNSDCHYEPYSSSRYEFILHYLKTIFHSFLKN